jgi:hypothetical protein
MGLFSTLALVCGVVEFYYGNWCYYHNHKGPAGTGYRTHILMGLIMLAGSAYLASVGI